MIRNRLAVLAIAALALGAAACGDDDSTGPSPVEETGTIRLLNEATVSIVSVQFTKCSDDSWGPNRLGGSETLAPGQLRTWEVEPGCYDLRASTGTRMASWYDRELSPGGALQLAVPAAVSASRAGESGDAGLVLRKER